MMYFSPELSEADIERLREALLAPVSDSVEVPDQVVLDTDNEVP